jgi:hypothetical protein
VRHNARNGATASNASADVAPHDATVDRFRATTGTTTAWTTTISTTNTLSSVDTTSANPYSGHSAAELRRAAATTSTVTQTAAAAVSA